MRSFHSFEQAAAYFGALAAGAYRAELLPVLDEIGKAVKAEVESEIGTYQAGIGPFPATAPLAQSTIDKKGNDNPWIDSGAFKGDIDFKSDMGALAVEIGTHTPYLQYVELGTAHMPPRTIFGPSLLRSVPKLIPMIQVSAFTGIIGGAWKGLGTNGMTFTQSGVNAVLNP